MYLNNNFFLAISLEEKLSKVQEECASNIKKIQELENKLKNHSSKSKKSHSSHSEEKSPRQNREEKIPAEKSPRQNREEKIVSQIEIDFTSILPIVEPILTELLNRSSDISCLINVPEETPDNSKLFEYLEKSFVTS